VWRHVPRRQETMDWEERKRILHKVDFWISQVYAKECFLCRTDIKQALEFGPQEWCRHLQCYIYFTFISFALLVLSLIEIPWVPPNSIPINLCVQLIIQFVVLYTCLECRVFVLCASWFGDELWTWKHPYTFLSWIGQSHFWASEICRGASKSTSHPKTMTCTNHKDLELCRVLGIEGVWGLIHRANT